MEFDELSNKVIGCALEVHKALGPGLMESVYEKCLSFELTNSGLRNETQKALPVNYKDVQIDCGYRIDILVENKLIVELKSVDKVLPIHQSQILTYMKLAGVSTGLLLNFNVAKLKDGIKRFVL
jgi:GxxExxY protein